MMSSSELLIDTDLDFPLLSRGKVRDVYFFEDKLIKNVFSYITLHTPNI